jgi:NAD(P)-dependent dehydrogenase (short-subunit alcohol dehydrogenase family)
LPPRRRCGARRRRWWGGHVNLNAEEIQFIVDELFIGNNLAVGRIQASDGTAVDLRNIRSPIVVFCSKGDNITPPQQALGWILDLYENVDEIRSYGTLFTMTYYGSQMVVKNYNIMGVAKAALEGAVRYIAAELGPKGIRVHAISPGPLATRAASGIPEFDALLDKAKARAPARSLVSIEDVGVATAFLAHDAARLITGETLYVDGGYHIMD